MVSQPQLADIGRTDGLGRNVEIVRLDGLARLPSLAVDHWPFQVSLHA
jgi:hypothetical protein